MTLILLGCSGFLLDPCSSQSWTEVSAGNSHVCTLDAAGEASCSAGSVVADPPAGPLHQLTGGYLFACALDDSNLIECWGKPQPAWEAVLTPPTEPVEQLYAGLAYACGLASGTLNCWGLLQDPDTENSQGYDLTLVPADLGDVSAFSAGSGHLCAIDSVGSLQCWGQTGEWIVNGAGPFLRVAAGNQVTCAQRVDNTVECWGADPPATSALDGGAWEDLDVGMLGVCGRDSIGITCSLSETAAMPEGARDISLSAEAGYGCILNESGILGCFGSGTPDSLPGEE